MAGEELNPQWLFGDKSFPYFSSYQHNLVAVLWSSRVEFGGMLHYLEVKKSKCHTSFGAKTCVWFSMKNQNLLNFLQFCQKESRLFTGIKGNICLPDEQNAYQ